MTVPELATSRLRLRGWRDSDREPFAALNADPEVTRFLGGPIPRAESDAILDRLVAHFDRHGFGLWAIEPRDGASGEARELVGFVGLTVPRFEARFTPCVEIGWRLARRYWGRGYATEGARESLRFGFEDLGLDEILSFTVPSNLRSRAVMERLGMERDPVEDFEHPNLPEGHALRLHVLYRMSRRAWADGGL